MDLIIIVACGVMLITWVMAELNNL